MPPPSPATWTRSRPPSARPPRPARPVTTTLGKNNPPYALTRAPPGGHLWWTGRTGLPPTRSRAPPEGAPLVDRQSRIHGGRWTGRGTAVRVAGIWVPPYALTRAPRGGTSGGPAEPDPRRSLDGSQYCRPAGGDLGTPLRAHARPPR